MTDDDTTTLAALIQERYKNACAKPGKAKARRPTKPCQYEGCIAWAWARGFCGSHYQKMRNEGKLPVTRRHVGDPVARFHASYAVNPVTGCWEWTGWIHPKGYGIMDIGGQSKKVRAHRFSWELHHGPIPKNALVLHTCDNRRCVNPADLFLGDDRDNMLDCLSKGRHWSQSGTPRREITPQMAQNIRIMYARGQHSMTGLAAIYAVDQKTISGIVNGRTHL